MNKITLTGRLVRDWAIRETTNGHLAKNTLVVNEKFGGKEKSTFIDLITFDEQQVQFITKYTKKGSKLLINGKLDINSYTGKCKECKADRSVREAQVVIDRYNGVEFLDIRDKDYKDVEGTDNSPSAWTKEKPQASIGDDIFSNSDTVPSGDLPF